ncbi:MULTISPECIES: hypothetical protein [unclassified Streptomyces]|uniref:hypothetical protein n=1 Tax=unclassified Streptomyces TaxID=2593676 RepID=UPI0024A9FD75|nr:MULTISPECIES: hypothetical protein [unclassified Streptomyces]
MTTQPGRISLDDLTSDALDQLYDERDAALQAVEYFDAQSKRRGERVRELEAARDRAAGLADRLDEFAENALRTTDRELYTAIGTDRRRRGAP